MITKEHNDLILENLNRLYANVHLYHHYDDFVQKEEADKMFCTVFNHEVTRFLSLISDIVSQVINAMTDKIREEVTKEISNKIRIEKIGLKIINNEKENIC